MDQKFQNLIKHLHLPIVISTHQHQKYTNPQLTKQGGSLFKVVDKSNDDELVQSTRLKLMLIDRKITPMPSFTTVNISDTLSKKSKKSEKLQPKYGATYPNATDKAKAQAHIKALLSDATSIKITDGYIATKSGWTHNKKLIDTLLPKGTIKVTIVGSDISKKQRSLNGAQKSEIETLCANWAVHCSALNSQITHDRYIETDKVKILLSSGLYHLSTSSSKDFTYIIELR
jgi:hypothetical protein